MSKTLQEQFKSLREVEGHINPKQEWVSSTRASLLSTISQTQEKSESVASVKPLITRKATRINAMFPKQLFIHMKPVFTTVLIFALATSGWIASASASVSLPGDSLWHVKLATEKTQIVLTDITGNSEKNVELQLKFANRRAEEIKTVSREGKFNKEEKAKRTEQGLKKLKENISSVDDVVQSAAHSDSTEEKKEFSKQAKEVNDATTQISETLEEVVDSVEAGSDDTTLTKEVVAVKQAVDEVGIDVVKVAVEGAENDEQRIAAQELVEEKLVSILSDADGALGESEEVKKLIGQIENPEEEGVMLENVETLVTVTGTVDIALETEVLDMPEETTTSGTPSTEEEIVEEPTTPKQTIATILAEVDKTSEKVTMAIVEIKALIEAGELGDALEKARELRGVTAASEQAAIDIKQAVKDVSEKQNESENTDEVVNSEAVPEAEVSEIDTSLIVEE